MVASSNRMKVGLYIPLPIAPHKFHDFMHARMRIRIELIGSTSSRETK